jgi:hypothetical protein
MLFDTSYFYTLLKCMNEKDNNPYVSPQVRTLTDDLKKHNKAERLSVRPNGDAFPTILAVTLCLVYSVSKWWLPAVLGTGPTYSLGKHLEELVASFIVGFVLFLMAGRISLGSPFLFFFTSYLGHLPMMLGSPFFILVLGFGVVSSVSMFFGILAGWLFSHRWGSE